MQLLLKSKPDSVPVPEVPFAAAAGTEDWPLSLAFSTLPPLDEFQLGDSEQAFIREEEERENEFGERVFEAYTGPLLEEDTVPTPCDIIGNMVEMCVQEVNWLVVDMIVFC